jgi:subtilisin
VAGLAALVLAVHPLFQGPLAARSEQRVSTLFGLLRASAALPVSDPQRIGAGVPSLQRVPGLLGGLTNTEGLRSLATPGMMPGFVESPFAAPFHSGWTPAAWQTLMQMRAAGLI